MKDLFMNILNWIYSWVGNYGWSIVLFTLLIRIVLLPLDIRSKKGMRAMQKVQPKVQALQKKYANDKEKLNQKTMELYRKEHVSMTAGCLPMLISLPILFIMFNAMRTVGDVRTSEMYAAILNNVNVALSEDTEFVQSLEGQTDDKIDESVSAWIKEADIEAPDLESWLWIKNVYRPDSFASTMLHTRNDAPVANLTDVTVTDLKDGTEISVSKDDINAMLGRAYYNTLLDKWDIVPEGAFRRVTIPLLFANPTINLPTSFSNLFRYANGLFILPLLAGLSQFFMTKITNLTEKKSKKKEEELPATQDDVSKQSNPMNSPIMKWFFPIFSVYICATSNAAFSIYWMAANVIAIVQQLALNAWFNRQDEKAELAAAQATDDI